MTKIKFSDLLDSINSSPSGGFVGITDYTSSKGDVVSIVGRVGCSYGTMKEEAIAGLKVAIDNNSFEPITVSGKCYMDSNGEFNARKKSCPLQPFNITFTGAEVLTEAKGILEGWEKPSTRKSNKVQLSDKENGLSFNKETGTFTIALLVENETYKVEASELLKEELDIKPKVTAPISLLKAEIRKQFERKIKSFSIKEGNFKQLSINGTKYSSKAISF